MRLILLIFLFGLTSGLVLAKGPANVSGKVLLPDGNPAEMANVILLQASDSSLVKGAVSDADGSFSLPDVPAGSYLLMVSQLGGKHYAPSFSILADETEHALGTVQLPAQAVTLKEAHVTAFKPFIEHRIDETIVNVENSIVNAGGTALEVLKRSPGVTVDNEGNIRLAGKQGVQVMIDGKPTYLSPKDLFELLRNTPSDQLSQIVIITNPSARYDAAGNSGILNIRMKKKQNMGLNGNFRISYGQGVYPDFGTGLQLNYRNEKFNVFGGYDFMRAFYFEEVDNVRRFNETGYESTFDQYTFDKGDFYSNNFRGGLDYFLDKKNTLGLLVRGNIFDNHDDTKATTDIYNQSSTPDSGYVTNNINDSQWHSFSANLNFLHKTDTLGSEWTVDLDLARYNNASDFTFLTQHYYSDASPGYAEVATNRQPAHIDIFTAKTDWIKMLATGMKLEAGAKTSFVKTDNDVRYTNYYDGVAVPDTGKSNHFNYKENINAVYVNWAGEFGKWGLQAGLRGEQTVADGVQEVHNESFHHNYFDLFPSAFLTYTASAKNKSQLSFSRRVDRPGYQQLNPFRYFIDPYNYYQGNPNLNPQFTHVFELSHIFLQSYTLSLNYSHTMDAMTQIARQIDSIHTTYLITENVESNDHYGVRLSIPVRPFTWWESNNNLELYSNEYRGVTSVGQVEMRMATFSVNSYNTFALPKGWSAELNGYYRTSALYGTMISDPLGSVSAGFSKRFWKDRILLRVNVNDIFHTEITTSTIQYQNIDVDFQRVYDSQFVRFHVSYNFGKKTVPRSRQHASGSQEEQNRINTSR